MRNPTVADAPKGAMRPSNAPNLEQAMDFLGRVLDLRLRFHFEDPPSSEEVDPPPLAYYQDGSPFCHLIEARQPSYDEYLVLALALAPHVSAHLLDSLIGRRLPKPGEHPELGGSRDNPKRAFLPTGETAVFLLAGEDLERRLEVGRLFTADHWFDRDNILTLETVPEGVPPLCGRLLLSRESLETLTLGQVSSPSFGAAFPAREISTELDWSDLVLSNPVLQQIEEIRQWIDHQDTLMNEWKMRRRLKPGYRVLFHGPSGTGKSLTATLLGKKTGRKVFRIDLSTVVSKYIGETEKNLANLFDKATDKDWILFFDEADALFGRRTNVKDSHDRYANQEVSYLLQRIEEFDGLVILASNFKANIDEAFLRRFNGIIRFPIPTESEREAIWRASLPSHAHFPEGVDLPALVSRFELTGGNIVNAVQHACISAIARNSKVITIGDALQGVRREVEKEGKVFRNILDDEIARIA